MNLLSLATLLAALICLASPQRVSAPECTDGKLLQLSYKLSLSCLLVLRLPRLLRVRGRGATRLLHIPALSTHKGEKGFMKINFFR